MALQPYPGFLGPDNKSSSVMADGERLVNLYPQPLESPSAPVPWVLLPTPGYRQFLSGVIVGPGLPVVPTGVGRANFSMDGRSWVIFGEGLYEYFANGDLDFWGFVAQDANPATICSNGTQLFVTSANQGYLWTIATTAPAGVVVTGARMGAFLDGFFLALDADTSTLKISNLFDGLVWNPLQVAQRTAGADTWQAMYVVNRLIYLQGSATSEVWTNLGTAPFPFGPIQEGFSQHGTAAPFSGAVDSSLTFLGRNANGRGIVYRMQGYTPQRISTHAVEVAIQSYARIDDGVAGITQQEGRPVYVLTFPDADRTHAFDEGTNFWHEKTYWDPVTATAHASRAMFFAAPPAVTTACDRRGPHLFAIDPTVFTEADGRAIQRIRVAPRLSSLQQRFTVNSLQLTMDVGVGLATGQGADPQVMLQVSKNGGQTFGNERWVTAGPIGRVGTRVRWTRLGQGRNFVPRVVFSEPVPFRISEAVIDVTPGTS
jgi:hypothetical protein